MDFVIYRNKLDTITNVVLSFVSKLWPFSSGETKELSFSLTQLRVFPSLSLSPKCSGQTEKKILAKWCCLSFLYLAAAAATSCRYPQPSENAEEEMGHQET